MKSLVNNVVADGKPGNPLNEERLMRPFYLLSATVSIIIQ